ncbi:hypothetical protein [Brachybacterium saurashtrense]|uniref:Uncharacterized protein n=1 Tax=Brachybacterium saurashtrense TaxID=556288 RepID=A0A345YS01_9MICO|nr:hypothetical protein [Brachybacterium saurashtrense]AXK46703.1 hypothetical protein DWV08_14530 [Brachybacterium saurashtrense]RRR22417.1 hypothetical protein DXU92_09145 [Brachybacterium saurashtrense]
MSAGEQPSADRPRSSGSDRLPDPTAPDAAPDDSRAPATTTPDADRRPDTPPTAPGDRDLPWKATAERRDLWGPVQGPLDGTVHGPGTRSPAGRSPAGGSPHGGAVGRPRRSPLVRFGAPVVLGALAALAALLVVLGAGLGGPLLALAAAAGIGAVTLGAVGVAANRPLPAAPDRPTLDASVTGGTREMLAGILEANGTTRDRVAQLRPQASSTPAAVAVLDDVTSLLTRIDALVGAEQLQAMRPSAAELTLLDGIAGRYVPELVDAASDTIGFLRTFAGSAREEALANLASIDTQLNVLAEGVEQVEGDVVGGVSRSLEVHSEFLRARFADQHVDPLIDIRTL